MNYGAGNACPILNYFPFGGLFPLPEPDGFPVVPGPLGGLGVGFFLCKFMKNLHR